MIDVSTASFSHLLINFLLALGVGLTMGVERAVNLQDDWKMAGLRDFILVAGLAFVSSLYYALVPFAWIGAFVTVIFFTLSVFIIRNLQVSEKTVGMTTLLALPFTFLVASLPNFGAPYWTIATIVFIILLVLGLKVRFYQFARSIDRAEIIDFAILIGIAISITPLIPAEAKLPIPLVAIIDGVTNVTYRYVRFEALWNVVVMVSLMSFTAHFVTKYVRGKNALVIATFLGGLVSSLASISMLLRNDNNKGDGSAPLTRQEIFLGYMAANTGAIFKDIMILHISVSSALFNQFAFPLISIFVLFSSISFYAFSSQGHASTVRMAHRPLPLSFIFKFSGLLVALIIIMTMVKFYLGAGALIPTSFLSGIVSSAAAITSIGAAMSQVGGMSPWTAGLAIMAAMLGSLYAKYVVISRHLGFSNSKIFLLPILGMAAVGLLTLWISLNNPV